MSDIFLDSSGVAKRYLAEVGSPWVRGLTASASGHRIWLSRATEVEFASAVTRRWREASITQADRNTVLHAFDRHAVRQYEFLDLDRQTVKRAKDLLLAHPLRAYDAVQLASALVLNETLLAFSLPPVLFVCADDRLIAAGLAEGLAVENPLNHP